MPRPADKDRLIWFLQEQGRSSNRRARAALQLADERYAVIRSELLDEGIIEKVKGQGGGVQLTVRGLKEKTLPNTKSAVENEKSLYGPFQKIMQASSDEDEDRAMVIDTSALRMSGKWSNPDITKISVRTFPILRTHKILVTTYELKQWKRWNIESVFEAASQRRFAHESNVVLEWAKGEPVSGIDDLMTVCGRFGVGLLTIHPYYSSFQYVTQLDAENHAPNEENVEEFLGYVFEKYPQERVRFNRLCEEQGL